MPRISGSFIAAIAAVGLFATSALAQQIRHFESRDALEAEIAEHMAAGNFSGLVESVAPPARMSTGRIRILEQAYEDNIPSLENSVSMFRSNPASTVLREVTAWWDGEIYVYLGLLTHAREDDVVILDFALTSDVRQATRWFHTGSTQQR